MTPREIAQAAADGEYKFCPSHPDKCKGCEFDIERLVKNIEETVEAAREDERRRTNRFWLETECALQTRIADLETCRDEYIAEAVAAEKERADDEKERLWQLIHEKNKLLVACRTAAALHKGKP